VLPKELDEIFEEYTEDDYNLYITKIDYSTDDFIFDFCLEVQDINDKGEINQTWSVVAKGHRKNKLSFDFEPFIKIETEHPLLWEFHDTQCELYYSGQCEDIPKLFYDLYNVHREIFGNSNDLHIYLGDKNRDAKKFDYTNGLVAKGSKTLLLKYADCLKQNQLDYTIIGERPPKYWNGQEFIVESNNLKILFFGKGYVIAQDFAFVLQDKNSR